MSECTLLLRLTAPLQSWGTESKFDVRRTCREPSKSGVIGLVAAAMGIRRDEDEKIADLAKLRMGVRVEREGTLLRDYQMVKAAKPYVTNRYYLSDACFLVGLESEEYDLLNQMNNALLCPVFPLFLGRRSCPPTGKLCLGIREMDLEDALHSESFLETPDKVRYIVETRLGEYGKLLRDEPISFNPAQRKYTFRQVQETIQYIKEEYAEHDPMAELE